MTTNMNQTVKQRPFNPATKALQFRAWQIAQREGGNITRSEIAAELRVSPQRLLNVIRGERWADTLRAGVIDRPNSNGGASGYSSPDEVDAMAHLGAGSSPQPAE